MLSHETILRLSTILAGEDWVDVPDLDDIKKELDDAAQEFPVTSIRREDLLNGSSESFGLTEEQAATLTDEDMTRIARELEDSYVSYGNFWQDAHEAAQDILKERNKS